MCTWHACEVINNCTTTKNYIDPRRIRTRIFRAKGHGKYVNIGEGIIKIPNTYSSSYPVAKNTGICLTDPCRIKIVLANLIFLVGGAMHLFIFFNTQTVHITQQH
jgi:hypothetical protein